ncbi:MAG: gliding motility-associated C-terminal domain-containing protein, partial [Flavobacterium sp.]|nr:gliding motility-associated C-terminal domain-containing protein [Flavobacterium sp.]
ATNTYTFTPDNPNQCGTIFSQTITVINSITPDFVLPSTICSGGIVPALNTTSMNGITGAWNFTEISNTATNTYTFTPDNPNQCGTIFSQIITVNTPTTPTFDAIAPICIGQNLLALPTTSNNNISGTWSPSLNNLATTEYTFSPNGNECATNQKLTIIVNSGYCDIQKGISPNGDKMNDYFDLSLLNVKQLNIYNRYGLKVYSKSNYSNEWIGQSNSGFELPDSTYFYEIELRNQEVKTGWIYLNKEI